MITAAVVPVGFVPGYTDTLRVCLASMARELDRVYCVLSTRGDAPYFDGLPVTLISDESTWFGQVDGVDVYQFARVTGNVRIGYDAACRDGAGQVVLLCCNWYVTPDAGQALRRPVERWGWVTRRAVLGGQMFHADKRIPNVLRAGQDVRFWNETTIVDGEAIHSERGEFPDAGAVVDMELEVSRAMFAARMEFVRCYRELMPKRRAEFDWGYWEPTLIERTRTLARAADAPPITVSGEDFVSTWLLGALGPRETDGTASVEDKWLTS